MCLRLLRRGIESDHQRALMSQFCERRFDPREYRGLSELRKNAFCLGQVLNREIALFLNLVYERILALLQAAVL
jgi:hypothetical protein